VRLLFSVFFSFCVSSASAAVLALDGTVTTTETPLNNLETFTTDILIDILDLSSALDENFVIFESGGDGSGVAIWLDVEAEALVFYQDRGAFSSSTPANDTMFTLGISSFSDTQVVIRLEADYSEATNTAAITVTDGVTTLTTGTQILSGSGSDGVGGNPTGLGTVAGDHAGQDELVANDSTFNLLDYAIPSGGSLMAVIYETDSMAMPPPSSIPTP